MAILTCHVMCRVHRRVWVNASASAGEQPRRGNLQVSANTGIGSSPSKEGNTQLERHSRTRMVERRAIIREEQEKYVSSSGSVHEKLITGVCQATSLGGVGFMPSQAIEAIGAMLRSDKKFSFVDETEELHVQFG